jgi:hypothetical protein
MPMNEFMFEFVEEFHRFRKLRDLLDYKVKLAAFYGESRETITDAQKEDALVAFGMPPSGRQPQYNMVLLPMSMITQLRTNDPALWLRLMNALKPEYRALFRGEDPPG